MKRKNQGFTLIELMIVVAIVGLLSAIAYPSYVEHLEKGRRVIAQGELLSFASAMEQWYVQHGSDYRATNVDDVAPNVYAATITIDGIAMYNIAVTAVTASAYTIRATPIPGTAQYGNGYIELTSTGGRSWNKPSGLINFWE
jgi:type IV pilus assembly protein PilE